MKKMTSLFPIKLYIVFKLVERCNINCTYCYVFNGESDDWKFHPPYVKREVVDKIIQFLVQGCKELNISNIKTVFHGGEPLMYKKGEFDELCSSFSRVLIPYTKLDFALQTNAMLVSDEWISLFHKYNIKIGVSLDGPKEYNDVNRLDHKGRGTYDRVVTGLRRLQEAARKKLIDSPGILTVVNPKTDARKIYRHFVDELNIKGMDFLLPDITHDTLNRDLQSGGWQVADFGKYICDVFNEWIKDDNPKISVRIIDTILQFLLNDSFVFSHFGNVADNIFVLTINSDGSLGADATLTNANVFNNLGSIYNMSLKEFLHSDGMRRSNPYLDKGTLSPVCSSCNWVKLCNGGQHINRYSHKNGFASPSVFCEALKMVYERITEYALSNGLPVDILKKRLRVQA